MNNLYRLGQNYSFYDFLIFLLLFAGIAVFPTTNDWAYVTTTILWPVITILLIFHRNASLKFSSFIQNFILLFALALISLRDIDHLSIYGHEIKQMAGVILTLLILAIYIALNNVNTLLLYWIYIFKFLFMGAYLLYGDLDIYHVMYEARFKSGYEIGINANAFGYFSFLALFACANLLLEQGFKLKMILITVFVATAMILINVITASRGGLLLGTLALIVIIISFRFKKKYSTRMVFLKFIPYIIIISFLSYGLSLFTENLVVFSRINEFAETGKDERITILINGIDLILKNPFGIGAGEFPYAMSSYQNLQKIAASHNSFLLIGANYGVFSIFIYLLVFYNHAKLSLKLLRINTTYTKRFAILNLSFCILFFVYNFLYDMILNLYIITFFFIMYSHQRLILGNFKTSTL